VPRQHKTTRTEIRRNLARQLGPDGASPNTDMRICYSTLQALPAAERDVIERYVETLVNEVPHLGCVGAFEIIAKIAQTASSNSCTWIFPQEQELPHG
jgi:hypothetical protein